MDSKTLDCWLHVDAKNWFENDPIRSFVLAEALSEPCRLRFSAPDYRKQLQPVDLDGKNAVLTFGMRGRPAQAFHGQVTDVILHSDREDNSVYEIEVTDPFSIHDRATTYRAFEHQTVNAILQTVFSSRRVANDLPPDLPTIPYRVQYFESDFAFASRLLEEAGLWYFFHDASLTARFDSTAFHRSRVQLSYSDDIESFEVRHRPRPLNVAGRSYLYETETLLRVKSCAGGAAGPVHEAAKKLFPTPATIFHDRMEEAWLQADADAQSRAAGAACIIGIGRSVNPAVRPGVVIDLVGMPRSELNGAYFVVDVAHSYVPSSEESKSPEYHNDFKCIPADVKYSATRKTALPRINGIQVGSVVAPSKQQQDANQLGRVRIKFAWLSDEVNAPEQAFSCWARVAQPHAGTKHGFVFMPELGDEVLVSFESGNPDLPVVVGSLYTGTRPPTPPPLDDKNAVKLIRTRSGNVIRLEDLESESRLSFFQPDEDKKTNLVELKTGQKPRIDIASDGTICLTAGEIARVEMTREGAFSVVGAGNAALSIDNEGNISIHGKTVAISSTGTINVTATGELVCAGTKIKLN